MPVPASSFETPAVDEDNPLYCPSLPAGAYMQSLRSKLEILTDKTKAQRVYRNSDLFVSYARGMDTYLRDLEAAWGSARRRPQSRVACAGADRDVSTRNRVGPDLNPVARPAAQPTSKTMPAFPSTLHPPRFAASAAPLRHATQEHTTSCVSAASTADWDSRMTFHPDIESTFAHKSSDNLDHEMLLSISRYCDDPQPSSECSDPGSSSSMAIALDSVPQYARSPHSTGSKDISFEIEVRRQKLRYPNREIGIDSGGPLAPVPVANEPKEGEVGWQVLDDVARKLDRIFPGIRLHQRLWALEPKEHSLEGFLKYMIQEYLVNASVIECFARLPLQWMVYPDWSQDTSLGTELNLFAKNVFVSFKLPGTFTSLRRVVIQNIPIDMSDVFCVIHLPNVESLDLGGTGLTNEGVFMLVHLKSTLTQLDVSCNNGIDNDSIPVFILLDRLDELYIQGTSIDMPGLRKLGLGTFYRDHKLWVITPESCHQYLQEVRAQRHYLLHPQRPLIRDPQECLQLDESALKANLEAHASCNSSILTSGTRSEMVARLQAVLQTRREDLLAQRLADYPDPV